MNEEFAIQLKTILDQSSINQVKEQLKELKEFVGDNITKATSAATSAKANINVSDMEATVGHAKEIEQILNRIADLETTISAADALGLSKSEILELEVEVEKLRNKLASLSKGGQTSSLSMVQKTTVNITNNFKKAVKQVMRLGLALVGVRGVYGTISRAMRTYLSQNEELQNKLNGAWYALGSLFAPVLEKIINMFIHLISLVDAFVKALGFAGINMSKYGKAAGGAAKKQKALMGIDEINNIQDQNGGGSGGSNFKLDPISDEELEKFKTIGILVAGIAAGLAAWKLSDTFLKALGATKWDCIGIGLAIAGATIYVLAFLDAWKNGISLDNLRLMLLGVALAAAGLAIVFGPVGAAIALLVGGIGMAVLAFREFIKTGELTEEAITAIVWGFGLIGAAIGLLIGGPLGALVGFIIGTVIGTIVPLVLKNLDKIKEKLSKAGSWFKSSVVNPIISGVNGLLKGLGNGINKVIDMLNKISFDVPDWVPKLGGKHFGINLGHVSWGNIPLLETGTNYVPNDMLAMLHQGEAVVPKKFNQNDMYGQVSEEELNLLSSINEQLIELNRKDTTINLDGTNLAERINNKIQDITYRNGERVFAVAR